MRLWLVALIGVATILVVQAVAHQGNEPTLEEEEEEEERLKMEEVTQSPPVTPPSRAGSGYDLTFSALTSTSFPGTRSFSRCALPSLLTTTPFP